MSGESLDRVVAEAIQRELEFAFDDDGTPYHPHVPHMAGDVLSALREALTVRSVEELDALPDDTAVLVDDCPARKHLGDWYFANDDGDGYGSKSLALYLPALVLYRPDWSTP